MNKNHINQIFANYIDRFEEMNGPVHQEYFKWQVAKRFRPMMDDALSSNDEAFPQKLSNVKKITSILIDGGRIQPFNGLVQFAKKEPATVRQMFSDLYFGTDPAQERIYNFIVKSKSLKAQYFPNYHGYGDSFHSATAYLAMYDPDNHYIFKASHALKFAACIEFYDDWGSGDTVKLNVYYRMCDQLVESINGCEELIATVDRRFAGELPGVDPDSLHKDQKRHILAFDLIYCCSTYNLYDGMEFQRLSPSGRRAFRERQDEAERKFVQLSEELDAEEERLRVFETVKGYLSEFFAVGSTIVHKTFGQGVVSAVEDTVNGPVISVSFPDAGIKRIDLIMTIRNRIISTGSNEHDGIIEAHKNSLELFNHTKLKALENSIKAKAEAINSIVGNN